ncbi:MAG: tetratricopeptide repeat protein [Gammaproteobacteria bacterium]|jgi:tetratricopeptide (TPR) repeat protein|nr:tetratricopeptide repeat protein [Gammaproteobacteria bacterium]|tara:strand:- start:84 stop:1499 length:1416 start_codon:yes stop_codon:yes gene_type:complete
MIIVAALFQSIATFSQSLEIDLGVDLENPEFLREFNGSFEVGLRPGAPQMNAWESVIISVVSDSYRENIDEALSFILEESQRGRTGLEARRRNTRTNEFDQVLSANIEYTVGQLYQMKGNRAQAERYYLQAIEKYPSYVSAYARLMEIYLSQQDCEKAIAAGKMAIEIGGVNGFVFRNFGTCYFLEQEYDAALNAFRIARTFIATDEASDYYYAMSAINMGYADEAVTVLEEMIREYPEKSSYYFLQVNAYLLKDDYDGALETLEIARRKGILNVDSYSLLGNIYINKEMPGAAAEAFISGLGFDELPAFPTVLQQFNYLSRLGDWQVTEIFLSEVLEAYEGRLDVNESRSLRVMEARVLIDSSRATDGADLLREVIDADPTNGDALLSLARYYRQQQDFERAGIYFQRAASEDSVALEALMENAQLATDQEDWQAAIGLLTSAGEIAAPDTVPTILENIRAIERILEIID